MPRPSAFDDFTPKEMREFEMEFERRHFKKIDDMTAWLNERGFDVGRSAVARQGVKLRQNFQRNLDMVKTATMGAQFIAEATKDDNGKMADGLTSLVQGGLFDVLSNLSDASEEENPEERLKLLSNAARASADITRASIATKKFRLEMEERINKALQAAEPIAKSAGLSDNDWAAIRAKFLGVEIAS
jgi:hypothetical protein